MTKSTKTILWVVGIVVVVVIIIAATRGSNTDTSPIKIGFVGPLTGDAANIGQNVKAAVGIAVDEVNSAGGISGRQLQVIYEDGKCNGKDAVSAAQKLISIDKVPLIFGGACSGETSAFTDLAKQNNTVVFSYCSSAPALSTAGIFRDYPSDNFQGSYAANYIKNTLNKSKVAIMYVKSDWGVGIQDVFAKKFAEFGGTIVANEGYEQTATDFRSQITKIKAANPDVIYFLGYTDATVPALKQFKQLGVVAPLIGGDAWDDSKIITGAGSAAEGISYVIPATNQSSDFKAKMSTAVGNNEITVCTPQAYDGIHVLAQVLKSAGTDPSAIRKALAQVSYTGGVSSKVISFDSNGDLKTADYIVKVVRNGQAVPVQ